MQGRPQQPLTSTATSLSWTVKGTRAGRPAAVTARVSASHLTPEVCRPTISRAHTNHDRLLVSDAVSFFGAGGAPTCRPHNSVSPQLQARSFHTIALKRPPLSETAPCCVVESLARGLSFEILLHQKTKSCMKLSPHGSAFNCISGPLAWDPCYFLVIGQSHRPREQKRRTRDLLGRCCRRSRQLPDSLQLHEGAGRCRHLRQAARVRPEKLCGQVAPSTGCL